MDSYFVTGIGTDVGKTVVSAILTQALEADYWKPVQAGSLDYSDTDRVRDLVANTKTNFFMSAFSLQTPMSPHAAAEIDKVHIEASEIKRPKTKNNLIIEGAGGLLVPINQTQTIADLIHKDDKVIVVSRHYLGSINHSLLTLQELKAQGFNIHGIIFSGDDHPTTEQIIEAQSGVRVLGRIEEEPYFDANVVDYYAQQLKEQL